VLKHRFIPSEKNNYNPVFSTKVAIVLLTLWVLLFNTFSTILFEKLGVYASTMTAERIIELTNQERAQRGLNTLQANALLTSAAYAKANNMFQEQYWDHFGPNGETPWQFIKAAGYAYTYAGENLAKGFTTSEGVHQAWMASPTHRDNIVSDKYRDIGIAIVSGNLLGEDIFLVVQMFGNVAGVVDVQESPMLGETQVQETPVPQPKVEVRYETGEDKNIKSIRIIYPEDDETYIDPQLPIRGDAENFVKGAKIEIVAENTTIGETNLLDDNTWEFINSYDWKEGRNDIDAVIQDGQQKYRDSVGFTIKSTPPEILGVNVEQKEGKYIVEILVEEGENSVSIVIADKIFESKEEDGKIVVEISKEDVKGTVFVVVSDVYGNVAQEDITSYFEEQEDRSKFTLGGLFTFNISSVQRMITILLAAFVLAILLIQLYAYKKAGKFKERAGDFLTVGIWWLVFLFGSFIGYSGSIN